MVDDLKMKLEEADEKLKQSADFNMQSTYAEQIQLHSDMLE